MKFVVALAAMMTVADVKALIAVFIFAVILAVLLEGPANNEGHGGTL